MILADKIIMLRKRLGWSQEELAEKLGVSRQSVSKWEGALSVPDLNKILAMAGIFGVSTDFLLKDEIETPEIQGLSDAEEVPPVRHVSMEEANSFLDVKAKTAKTVAIGTALCILSPIPLLFFGATSEVSPFNSYENAVWGIGLIAMFIMITIAVAMFISVGNKTSQYEYLEKELIETDYGVAGMVNERKNKYKPTYDKYNMIGTVLCILSVIPIFVGAFLDGVPFSDIFAVLGVCVMLMIVSVGVIFFVIGGTNWSSMQKLLQEGDYTKENKTTSGGLTAVVTTIYWVLATAVFLTWSIVTDSWRVSWIVWLIAGVLYPAVAMLCKYISGNKKS